MNRVGARHRFENGWDPKGFGDQDLRLPPMEQLGIGEPTGL